MTNLDFTTLNVEMLLRYFDNINFLLILFLNDKEVGYFMYFRKAAEQVYTNLKENILYNRYIILPHLYFFI